MKKKNWNHNNLAEHCITFEVFHKQKHNAEVRHFCWPKIINTIFSYQPTLAESKRYPVRCLYLNSLSVEKKMGGTWEGNGYWKKQRKL